MKIVYIFFIKLPLFALAAYTSRLRSLAAPARARCARGDDLTVISVPVSLTMFQQEIRGRERHELATAYAHPAEHLERAEGARLAGDYV